MTTDILLTVVNVACGLALTGIGIEMVNNPPGEIPWKRWLYRGLFLLFGAAVLVTTTAQSIRNTSQQNRLTLQAVSTERDLSDRLSKANGKLDAISHFEQQFLEFASKRASSDEGGKAYEAMALAVMKMAQGASTQPASDAHLELLYGNRSLNGQTISMPLMGDPSKPIIQLTEFRFKNTGSHVSGGVSVRLYLSKQINVTTPIWQPTASEDQGYPFAYYSGGSVGPFGGPPAINPMEVWNWPAFIGQMTEALNEPISAKMLVFYGATRPSEASFVIRKK